MGLSCGFPGADLRPGLKGLQNPFYYKASPVLYFTGKML